MSRRAVWGTLVAALPIIGVDAALAGGADLSLSKSNSPTQVGRGARLTYSLTVVNLGPDTASSIVLVDTLPVGVGFLDEPNPRPPNLIFADGFESGDTLAWSLTQPATACARSGTTVTCSLGTLASSGVLTITLRPKVSAAASGTLSNNAAVSSAGDPASANNSASSSATVVLSPIALALTLFDGPDPASPGGTLTYVATIANAGPATATQITFSDPLPPELALLSATPSQGFCTGSSRVTCELGTLLAGQLASVTLVTQISASAADAVTNAASVIGLETEPDLSDNLATAVTTLTSRRPR